MKKEVEVKKQMMKQSRKEVEMKVKKIMKKKRKEVKVRENMKKKVKVKMKKKMEKKRKKMNKWWQRGPVLRVVAVDVIKAWKTLPPCESGKASVVKMADDAMKPSRCLVLLLHPNLQANQRKVFHSRNARQ
ncbi:hypothetical protein Scep_009743 [Stephania cephalantha]|uniref:Uncharacterized protein n=1 Tax=Stephania cephalantha TaxID=152367 RepID=A0AAP0PDF4_9MAGN